MSCVRLHFTLDAERCIAFYKALKGEHELTRIVQKGGGAGIRLNELALTTREMPEWIVGSTMSARWECRFESHPLRRS